MFRVTSTKIKCSCRCYCSLSRSRLTSHNKTKEEEIYINLRDHQDSAIDIVADTGSPLINDIRTFFDWF